MQFIALFVIFLIILPTVIVTLFVMNVWKKKIAPKFHHQSNDDGNVYYCINEGRK